MPLGAVCHALAPTFQKAVGLGPLPGEEPPPPILHPTPYTPTPRTPPQQQPPEDARPPTFQAEGAELQRAASEIGSPFSWKAGGVNPQEFGALAAFAGILRPPRSLRLQMTQALNSAVLRLRCLRD